MSATPQLVPATLQATALVLLLLFSIPGAAGAAPPAASDDPAQVTMPFAANEEIEGMAKRLRRKPGGTREQLDAIIDLIFSKKDGLGFQYQRRPTLSAAEAVEERAGNCLSLVNLFVSLARGTNIQAVYVKVEDFEIYYRDHATIVRSGHVIGGAWVGPDLLTIDFLPERPKRYRKLREISDLEATVLFYNAVASEALLDGDLKSAETFYRRALAILPDFAETWNNYAILHRRLGDTDGAIAALEKAMEADPELLAAIENLASFYRLKGLVERAETLEARALELKTRNPYFLVGQATQRLADGNLNEAFDLARRAQRLEPAIPDSYLILGRIELARENGAQAERYFETAQEKSGDFSDLYRNELNGKIQRLLARNQSQPEEPEG